MMKTILASAGLLLAIGAGPALADRAAADACAAGLNAEAKAIYDASIGSIGGGNLKGVVTDATKSLVAAGTVSKSTARSSAMAAGACLQQAM